MIDPDTKVPTVPGWWWLCVGRFPQPVRVEDSSDGLCFTVTGNGWVPVTYYSNPGEWGGPVLSPSDHAALLAERDALRATVGRVEALRDELANPGVPGSRKEYEDFETLTSLADRLTEALEDR